MSLDGIPIVAQYTAARVLNSMPGGLLLAALAWLIARLAGKENSKARFAVWFCALLGVAGLPFIPALAGGTQASTPAFHSTIVLPGSWAVLMVTAWAAIASLAAVRVGCGFWKVRRLRLSAIPVKLLDLHPAPREVVEHAQASRKVTLCCSSAVTVPAAIGFFRPMVIVPQWALEELSPEQLKVILLHEFAHLQRWDDWTNLGQKLVRTVFFFHPAVWWIERRLSVEREMACDDAVLEFTQDPRSYAQCLVSIAEKSLVQRGWDMAQAIIGRARDTSMRVARILDGKKPMTRLFVPALGAMIGMAGLGMVLLPDSPKLVAFADAGPTIGRATAAAVAQAWPGRVKVVAAASRTSASQMQGIKSRHQAVAVPIYRAAKLDTPVMKQHPLPQPVSMRASAKRGQPEYLLVMQTSEYRADGSTIVRFAVWRLTFSPARRPPQEGIVPKAL